MPANTLKLFRQIHLYLGVFITPALLFFALTGALQTAGLHEPVRGSNYKPAAWIVKLAQLHKKQTLSVPVRKPRPDDAAKSAPAASAGDAPVAPPSVGKHHDRSAAVSPAGTPGANPAADTAPKLVAVPPAPASAPQKQHYPMKFFFLIVSLGLFTSTLTGLYMAYKYNNNKLLVTGVLLAGVVVPLLALPF